MFKRKMTVRFSDTDGLGHVNNSNFFTYMEEGRTEIFRLFNPALELRTWNLIVASAGCNFLRQVRLTDTLTVYTWIGKVGNSSFVVEQAIQNDAGEWVARGRAALIHFDYRNQQPVPIPAEIRGQLEEHAKQPEGVPEFRAL